MVKHLIRCVAVLMVVAVVEVRGEVALHGLFTDHMVIQREQVLPVKGTASAGENVTVTLAGQSKTAAADAAGKWRVEFAPVAVGGPYEMEVKGSGNTIKLTDILCGDVWMCMGQSNMVVGMQYYGEAGDKEGVDVEGMRFFMVPQRGTYLHETDVRGTWQAAKWPEVAAFSAVGFYFGREIRKSTGVPIGLIQSAIGGTSIRVWLSRETMNSHPTYKQIQERWHQELAKYPNYDTEFEAYYMQWETAYKAYREAAAKWKAAAAKAKEAGQPEPADQPQPPALTPFTYKNHSMGYAAMIAPLTDFPVKGIIWYQGESDSGSPGYYDRLKLLIEQSRRDWRQAGLPFLFVQITGFNAREAEPGRSPWAEVRDDMLRVSREVPNTAMAVIIELGSEVNIHPTPKKPVGERLALLARERVYGEKNLITQGPTYREAVLEGSSIRIKFDHVHGGLVGIDLDTKQPIEKLKGFAIAGEDKKYVWADATIDGETVVVSSAAVPQPRTVRYGWSQYPVVSLYNKEGLPAGPFKTDDWVP